MACARVPNPLKVWPMSSHYTEEKAHARKPALIQELMLGMLESLINAFIDLDAATQSQCRDRVGLIVRVKMADPYAVVYVLFTDHGIELSSNSPGTARIRVGGTALAIAGALLGGNGLDNNRKIHVWGDENQVGWLMGLLREFNLRTSAQRWLGEHLNITEILARLRRHDPSWLSDLMPMPSLMRDAQTQLRLLRQDIDEQEQKLRVQVRELHLQRRWDVALMLMLLLSTTLVLLPGDTLPARILGLAPLQISWLVFAVTLVCTRFWRRSRY